ncbi:DNA lyase [candidate division WWE3 bacterium]|uniref:DNA lyase n=1 Tax=candidate division WWE3 bacterium TaxID=2053526 RepID=A0A955LKP8_UNCKA|nr:DNA lyase [candidate division WWE3 bacterium]
MRLWSIHPQYLDTKGLVAVWREGLLAKAVLEGKTKGYTNHPQLIRFQQNDSPLLAINQYLHAIVDEADARGYNFDRTKLRNTVDVNELTVTVGQLNYELEHLRKKLTLRAPHELERIVKVETITPHPLFRIIEGDVEEWEKLK